MQDSLFVYSLSQAEAAAIAAGLRSANAFTLRRCQILTASARGVHTPAIAAALSCAEQTVRNAIHAFNQEGIAALTQKSSRCATIQRAFRGSAPLALREILRQSPRTFGHTTSLWTLQAAAATAYTEGLTEHLVSPEVIRTTLARSGVSWPHAKHWIASPDPAYTRKKTLVTGSSR